MDGESRRAAILERLKQASGPVSAAGLSRAFGVSRQIIVGDVALLRASGQEIAATPRGYVLPDQEEKKTGVIAKIAVRHRADDTETELNAIVDEGCTVKDVIVEHPIYGDLTGLLSISSRHDVREFIRKSRTEAAKPLSLLTEGTHLHTLICPDQAALDRVLSRLAELGVLLENP